MTSRFVGLVALFCISSFSKASAALVYTIDFTDGKWQINGNIGGSGDEGTNHGSTATSLTADTDNTWVGIRAMLASGQSIDTTGFKDLVLTFNSTTDDPDTTMAWDFSWQNDTDGYHVSSSQGFSFRSNSGSDPGSPDQMFDATADDGAITNLRFRLQANDPTEEIELSGFTITGTPLSVPEPSSILLCGTILSLGMGFSRRRPRSDCARL